MIAPCWILYIDFLLDMSDTMYIQETDLLYNGPIRQRKRKRGVVEENSRFEWQMQLKSRDVDKRLILPDVPCEHFALGTLSETCLKDVVSDVNV